MNPLAKSNVTLWKNSNYTSQNMPKNKKTMTQSLPAITNTRKRPAGEETKQVESEFIDNLK